MGYEIEKIKLSQKIFYYLLCHGQLDEQGSSELYKAYIENEDVMELVKSQAEISECQIERFINSIYIMPDMGNVNLGFSKAQLKKEMCKSNATDRDYYLAQFAILTLLSEFYDGQGSNAKSRDFLRFGEFQNIVSQRLKYGVEREKERENLESDTNSDSDNEGVFDYKSMSDAFEALRSSDNMNRQKTTKEGFLYSVIRFLEEQNLVIYVQGDDMINTTSKLDNIMEMKILNQNNYRRVIEAMELEMS